MAMQTPCRGDPAPIKHAGIAIEQMPYELQLKVKVMNTRVEELLSKTVKASTVPNSPMMVFSTFCKGSDVPNAQAANK
jgi:hypothetical protein